MPCIARLMKTRSLFSLDAAGASTDIGENQTRPMTTVALVARSAKILTSPSAEMRVAPRLRSHSMARSPRRAISSSEITSALPSGLVTMGFYGTESLCADRGPTGCT